MNRYQKVLVCILRSLGVLFVLYSAIALISASLMMSGMIGMSIFAMLPFMVPGLILYFAAIPIAKVITVGIDD